MVRFRGLEYLKETPIARVQSIERAFLLLDAIAASEMGVTELAARLEMPKSTVARIVNTLLDLDAVERRAPRATYRIGPRVFGLGAGPNRVADLVFRSRPHLEMLTREIGEDAGVSVPDGNKIRYVAQEDAENNIQVRDWTGTLLPMHVVSSGLVLLAHWPESQLDSYVEGGLAAYTRYTMTDPILLRERLERIRRDGSCWVVEEFAEGISSVASPIYDTRGRVEGAIHVHGPSYRFPGRSDPDAIARLVADAAQRISVGV